MAVGANKIPPSEDKTISATKPILFFEECSLDTACALDIMLSCHPPLKYQSVTRAYFDSIEEIDNNWGDTLLTLEWPPATMQGIQHPRKSPEQGEEAVVAVVEFLSAFTLFVSPERWLLRLGRQEFYRWFFCLPPWGATGRHGAPGHPRFPDASATFMIPNVYQT